MRPPRGESREVGTCILVFIFVDGDSSKERRGRSNEWDHVQRADVAVGRIQDVGACLGWVMSDG